MDKKILYSIVFALIVTAIIVCNFCFGYPVSYQIVLLLFLLFIVVFGENYKEISIGRIKLLKEEIETKNGEIKYLQEIINVKNIQTQSQTIVFPQPPHGITNKVQNFETERENEEKAKDIARKEEQERGKRYDRKKITVFLFNKFRDENGLKECDFEPDVQFDLQQICNIKTHFDYRINKGNQIILVDICPNSLILYRDQLYRKLTEIKYLRETPLKPDIKLCLINYTIQGQDKKFYAYNVKDVFGLAEKQGLLSVIDYKITKEDEKEHDLELKDNRTTLRK